MNNHIMREVALFVLLLFVLLTASTNAQVITPTPVLTPDPSAGPGPDIVEVPVTSLYAAITGLAVSGVAAGGIMLRRSMNEKMDRTQRKFEADLAAGIEKSKADSAAGIESAKNAFTLELARLNANTQQAAAGGESTAVLAAAMSKLSDVLSIQMAHIDQQLTAGAASEIKATEQRTEVSDQVDRLQKYLEEAQGLQPDIAARAAKAIDDKFEEVGGLIGGLKEHIVGAIPPPLTPKAWAELINPPFEELTAMLKEWKLMIEEQDAATAAAPSKEPPPLTIEGTISGAIEGEVQ